MPSSSPKVQTIKKTSQNNLSKLGQNNSHNQDKNQSQNINQLRAYFYQILSKKDYSREELRLKAEKLNSENLQKISQQQIQEVLDQLEKFNIINDFRLAENILEYYRKQKGDMWIKQKMLARKIPEDITQKMINKINSMDNLNHDHMRQTVLKKYKLQNFQGLRSDYPLKAKILRFLYSRGFSQAQEILQEWINN